MCVRTDFVLAWCFMFHSHKVDMKYDFFQKKNVCFFSFWPHEGVEGVFKDRICAFMFSFISFRRDINYLLPRLLNFWKPDTLPRTTNCYDAHAYMPQHQYLAFFVYIITVYTSLSYILKLHTL